MERGLRPLGVASVGLWLWLGTACGPSSEAGADGAVTDEACTTPGQTRCNATSFQECVDGFWTTQAVCGSGDVCDPTLACVECRPADVRTCVGNDVHTCNADGTVGEYVQSCELESCNNGACGDDCVGGTELIYVVDEANRFLSFNPADNLNQFTQIGTLDCPAGTPWPDWQPGPAQPFSMSVDRTGRAWVLYTSGEIFWVDVTDASCEPSPFVAGQQGYELFGMGFVSNSPGSSDETLFIAGGSSDQLNATFRLGSVNPATAAVTDIAQLPSSEFGPELTGTGDAELFGYYPGLSSTRVANISKQTAADVQTWNMPGLGNTVRAWAFAHWGGRFYIFVTTADVLGNTQSQVQLLDPGTGNVNTILPNIPYIIVGAGVSTCAPVVVE